jgi:hypothetical protein
MWRARMWSTLVLLLISAPQKRFDMPLTVCVVTTDFVPVQLPASEADHPRG